MKTVVYNKLVRDKIPSIIESNGKAALIKVASGTELLELLNRKLREELQEYEESGNTEELADIVEVIYGILDFKDITIEEFDNIRHTKNEERGAFKKGLVLLKVLEDE